MTRNWVIAGLVTAALIGVAAVSVRQAGAKDEQKADEPRKLVNEVIAKLKAEDYTAVIDAVHTFNRSVFTDDEWKVLENDPKTSPKVVAAMLQAVIEKVPGKFTGEVELAGKEAVGSGYVRYLIVQRFERVALVYTPTFYRTPRGWFLCELNYNTNIAAHLKPTP